MAEVERSKEEVDAALEKGKQADKDRKAKDKEVRERAEAEGIDPAFLDYDEALRNYQKRPDAEPIAESHKRVYAFGHPAADVKWEDQRSADEDDDAAENAGEVGTRGVITSGAEGSPAKSATKHEGSADEQAAAKGQVKK